SASGARGGLRCLGGLLEYTRRLGSGKEERGRRNSRNPGPADSSLILPAFNSPRHLSPCLKSMPPFGRERLWELPPVSGGRLRAGGILSALLQPRSPAARCRLFTSHL